MDYQIDNAKSVLKKNSKSFHWAGKFLPNECINRAAELYSFCRILDDIADNGEISSLKYLSNIRSNIKNISLIPIIIGYIKIILIGNFIPGIIPHFIYFRC